MDKIEIINSKELINYESAIELMQSRIKEILSNNKKELIWFLEHDNVYTQGTSSKENEIIKSNNIKVIKTNRGGKTTYHGPGQRIIYFMINLNKRKKDIRKFINIIEDSIILSLKSFGIKSNSDRKNIGIWTKLNNEDKKIGAIGIKVKKWIAYHGFSINISNDISNYEKIIPCGIKNKGITTLKEINNQNYNNFSDEIIKNLIFNLKI